MKKTLFLFVSLLILFSCKEEAAKDYVSLSGEITNKNNSEFIILSLDNQIVKKINVSEDGSFKDTLTVSKGKYILTDGHEYASLFLRPGDVISITLDANKFDETLAFEGQGSLENNFMIKKLLLQEELFENIDERYSLSKEEFNVFLEETKKKFHTLLKETENLDTDFIQLDIDDTESLFGYLGNRYESVSKVNKLKGKISPQFNDYENHKGGTTSLSDLKGKYVYIDVWATWCKPCIAEIPALKELEKELGDKIHFVSISVDKKDKYEAWKKMVTEKDLKGYQLFADKDWKSSFVQDYGVDGIPRFILIDPDGKVADPNAPRPTNSKTKELLMSLVK